MTIRTGSPCWAWDRFSPGGLDAGEAGRLPHRAHRTSTSGLHRPALFVRPCDLKLADSEPRPNSSPAEPTSPPGRQPLAASAPEVDGCTGPNGCILPPTAPGIRG